MPVIAHPGDTHTGQAQAGPRAPRMLPEVIVRQDEGDRRVESRSRRRLRWVARLFLLWAVVVLGRLIQLQVIRHREYLDLARQQQVRMVEIRAPRGTIEDCTGQTLAASIAVDSVCVNPMLIRDLPVAASILGGVLKMDPQALLDKMRASRDNPRTQGFFWVKRKISRQESESLAELRKDLPWIELRQESKREYPNGPLAAHVIGFVDAEENGAGGLELGLGLELQGDPGKAVTVRDLRQRIIESKVAEDAHAGYNVRLAIDGRIQYFVEEYLQQAAVQHGCPTGSVVVLDPHTGNILAMASFPRYDPNVPPSNKAELAARLNSAIASPFEPGSVFKVITLAAALETTSLNPASPVYCYNGRFSKYGRTLKEAKHGYGTLTVEQVLAKSSNIGAVQIGMQVGPARLLHYIRAFGFGRSTGLPLPAESPGLVWDLKSWKSDTIMSVPMGHEVSVTTLQLAQACAVVANGGFLVKPRLILSRQRPGQPAEMEPVAERVPVLKPSTVRDMGRMMEAVVLHGTGRAARLDGYSSAGKTGSAQIYDPETGQYTRRYNSSFMGYAPANKPAVVVVVTLNGAREFGGVVAAPVFKQVAEAALRILEVPKDPLMSPAPEQAPDEDSTMEGTAPGSPELVQAAAPGVQPAAPEADPAAPHGPRELVGPKTPDFRGKTLRQVMTEATALNLEVDPVGSGIAREQKPAPGEILPRDGRVRVSFTQ